MVGPRRPEPPAPKMELHGEHGNLPRRRVRKPCGCGNKDVAVIAQASAEIVTDASEEQWP